MSGGGPSERGEIAVDVAIIGAGPAGLTAGYLLTKAGKRVAIIEKDATHVGGLSRTVEHAGHRFAVGGQRFSSKHRHVLDLWNELLPDDCVEWSGTSRIYHEGKLYSYPLRPFEALGNLGVLRSTGCLSSYVWSKAFPIRDVRSVEDWTRNRFGRKLNATFFKPYAEKVWGMPCDAMSADWAAQRIDEPSLWGAVSGGLKRSLGLGRRRPAESFRRPRLGPGMMWEAARDRIEAAGGLVIMGHGLKQLASDGQGGWRLTATGADGELAISAGHAISSAPMRELAARLYPLPVSTIEASQLKYRDVIVVALMIGPDGSLPDGAIHINDRKVKVARVHNYGPGSPDTAAGSGAACIGLEYFCGENDELWSMADDELVELARREMDLLGLMPPEKIVGGAVVRQPKACPVYDETYAANVEAMRRELEALHPTLHLVGRNGMHRCGNQDHAVMTAMLTAENILAGHRVHDAWCVDEKGVYREAADDGAGKPVQARPSSEGPAPALVADVTQGAAVRERKAA